MAASLWGADAAPRKTATVTDEQILQLRAKGLLWREVGEAVGMTMNGVHTRWRRLAAAGHSDPLPPARDDTDQMVAMYQRGLPITQISAELGHGVQVVSRTLKRAGVEVRVGDRVPIENSELLRLRRSGLRWSEIAIKVGMNRSTLASRWRRMRRTGVTDPFPNGRVLVG